VTALLDAIVALLTGKECRKQMHQAGKGLLPNNPKCNFVAIASGYRSDVYTPMEQSEVERWSKTPCQEASAGPSAHLLRESHALHG
jgi:hypothetical protein